MNDVIKNLFSTEVMFGSFSQDIIAPVAEELLANVDFSSGGDVSDFSLLSKNHDLPLLKNFFEQHGLEKFKEYIKKVFDHELNVDDCIFKAWAANGAGKYSLGFHNHSGSQLSAVFYLMVENSQKFGGKFRFHDPRFNANRGMVEPYKFKHNDVEFLPSTGDFIIFPSYLYHSITTFHGSIRLILPVDMFVNAA
jgi:hypothetical protein